MPPCAAWWKLVFACDKYTGHSMPLAGVNVAKWMRSAVWAEARETDCEGLAPVTRRVPDELLPQTVREVTPMVTLERKASRTRELLLFQKDLWFAVGKSRYKAAVLDGNMAGEKFICFYPLRGDGKAPLTVVRGTRWLHVALNFRMDTVSAFEVPPTPIRDNYAFMRSGERLYHPAMVGAVQHAFSLFGDAEVDFYADDSRVEPKSIVWMRLRMPREAVEGHPLTEVVRAFWDGDGPGPRESERLNVCGGRAWHEPCVNMVVCAYGCYGALFIERTPMASMLYVTVPVLVGEDNYDSTPSLRAWVLSLPLHVLSSLPTISVAANGKRCLVASLGTCVRCRGAGCANKRIAAGGSCEPRLLLHTLCRKRKRIA